MIDWGKVDPTELEPAFRRDVETLLKASPVIWRVTSGYRSLATQTAWHKNWLAYKAYRAGTGPKAPFAGKAAAAGRSAHNYGLAIDVVPDGDPNTPGLQPDWTPNPGDAWYWLRDSIAPHPGLRHGSHFGDWPHIQKVNWTLRKNWKAVGV